MKSIKKIILGILGSFSLLTLLQANAQIIISEVDPSGSGTLTYTADWFELTNIGTSAVNITGWKMDDDSNSFGKAVALNGVSSIAAGQSVVFIESTGSTAATVEANFKTAWFGSNVPAGFIIGDYSGSGVGLGQSGDQVNIFNSSGTHVTGVDFGTSTQGVTFDNSMAQVGNNGMISTLSVSGVNGAFTSPTGEIGSPGAVPEPGTYALMLGGVVMLVGFQFFRRNNIA